MEFTRDLDHGFFPKLEQVAERLGTTAIKMCGVMMSESGLYANAHNPNGHASGIIQFMPQTLINLGWTKGHEVFRKTMSATAQLPYVYQYYKPYIGYLDSVAGLYVATFLPALVKYCDDEEFILTAKNGPLGWAYGPNAVFDSNKDYAITVGELEEAVERNCRGSRWAEIVARLSGDGIDESLVAQDEFDLRTTFGIQSALQAVGFDPGPIDGIPGPKTLAAVIAFQRTMDLVPDGIVGPLTKKALADAA